MPETPALARWWREPWWARLALAGILLGSTVLMVWNLARGGDFSFYEASARSMSESWRALLFGAFDPGATVTLDKLSGFAVPQALSIRLFGMSTAALALPQVIEGIITIWACSLVGLRWLGRTGGLVAAGAAASTPIFVSMFGHPMEDGLLTMALAIALLWWQRAVLTARWWPLLLAGLFVGIGFQAKMMQAWFIVPALVAGTLLAVGGGWGRRLGRSAALVGAAVVSSVAWMVAIQVLPASSRPFVDGSTDDDVFAMVFGYNGVDRLLPGAVAGAVQAGGGAGHGPQSSIGKLLDPMYTTQIGWLYPAAVFGIVLALWRWWPSRASSPAAGDRVRLATVVVLAAWLISAAGVLSAAHMPHTAYLAALGVQLALLTAVAAVEAIRRLRSPRRRERWFLAVLVLVQGAWATVLATVGGMPPVLAVPLYLVLGIGLVVAVVAATRPGAIAPTGDAPVASVRRTVPAFAGIALVALVAGPALYSAQVLDASRDGSGGDASVGARPADGRGPEQPFAVSAPALWGGAAVLPTSSAQLLDAVRGAGGGIDGRPLFLTDSWSVAAPIIDATGQEVLTDGGYSGQAEVFTPAQIRELISSGQVRLLVVKDHAAGADPVRQAVAANSCRAIRSWASTMPGGEEEGRGPASRSVSSAPGITLYSCS